MVHCLNINDKHFLEAAIFLEATKNKTFPPYKIKTKQGWKCLDPGWNFSYNHYKISALPWAEIFHVMSPLITSKNFQKYQKFLTKFIDWVTDVYKFAEKQKFVSFFKNLSRSK